MDIKMYILNNYFKIKNIIRKVVKGEFNEDIYHDTLLNVMKIMQDREADDESINYIITAFRNNVNREKQYAYNKYRKEVEESFDIPQSIEEYYSEVDTDNILSWILNTFGDKIKKCFILWCRGYSINELLNHFNVKSLYYKFSMIKSHIKELYTYNFIIFIIILYTEINF